MGRLKQRQLSCGHHQLNPNQSANWLCSIFLCAQLSCFIASFAFAPKLMSANRFRPFGISSMHTLPRIHTTWVATPSSDFEVHTAAQITTATTRRRLVGRVTEQNRLFNRNWRMSPISTEQTLQHRIGFQFDFAGRNST